MRAVVRLVSLRHLIGEWPRTLLTVAGVALGVAVFVSIRLANHSALASFSHTVDAVAGRANLQITGSTEGLDERVFSAVRATPGVVAAAPIVEVVTLARRGGPPPVRAVGVAEHGPYDETLMVLGVDLLAEGPFARTSASGPAAGANGVAFLADARAVAITRTLATRDGLRLGDTLTVLAAGRPEPLRVRTILESREFEQAFGGNVVVVDIATAQEVFSRAGRLDRIDLIVDPARRDAVQGALAARLPSGLEIGSPRGRTRQVENMVRAFGLNLTALSFIALFVATFLILNAVSIAVLRRRREIGILRAIGVTRGQITALFLAEGLVYGVFGSTLGLGLGTMLAHGTLGAVARTLSDLYLITEASTLRLDVATYAVGFGLGVGIALLSALAPALEAARTPPAATLRQGALIEARRIPIGRVSGSGVALLLLGAAVALWTVGTRHPVGGFVSAGLLLCGFSLLAPGFTLAVEGLVAPLLRRSTGIEGALGARAVRDAVARTSVVVAALTVSVGMMVALSIMVGSFRRTVETWVNQTVRGDLYVEPVGHRLNGSATVLPAAFVAAARQLPGVAAVDTYRGARITLGDRVAFVIGVDFAVQRRYGRLQFVHGEAGAILARAIAGDEAIVSESFARHQRVATGDRIVLPTPWGVRAVRVAGVFYDYSTDAGAVLLDRGLYARLWRDERTESLALYLAPGARLDDVRKALLIAAGDRMVLSVIPNRALRARVLTVFDQTFQITYALQGIAILVAVLGVIGTLTALILQRGREIGVLRATGALRSQVRTMVLVESGLIGFIGALLGCVAGFALSLVLIHVINRQFFGWTVRMSVEPAVFARAVALMVVTAVLAGLGPARFAATRVAAEAMRME
jgi:putative ABC transport system permease protein